MKCKYFSFQVDLKGSVRGISRERKDLPAKIVFFEHFFVRFAACSSYFFRSFPSGVFLIKSQSMNKRKQNIKWTRFVSLGHARVNGDQENSP